MFSGICNYREAAAGGV